MIRTLLVSLAAFLATACVTNIDPLASGKTTAGLSLFLFHDGIKPPAIAPPTEAELPDAAAYLAKTSPLVTSPVRLATLEHARFGAGRDFLSVQPSCGGWYTGSAKPDASRK